MEIKSWIDGTTLYQTEAESFKALVEAAVKAHANLSGADLSGAYLRSANLSGADLSGANLSGADLSGAYLRSANLSGADLSGADLSGADLRNANLSGAYLRNANLSGAYLRSANLSGAYLSGANLSGADLSGAYLSGANLRSANLPAPTMVLLAIWGTVSAQLTADLMEFDASGHPDRTLFEVWKNGGECPYAGQKIHRLANFTEQKTLWGTGKPDTIYNLMARVLKEKTKWE